MFSSRIIGCQAQTESCLIPEFWQIGQLLARRHGHRDAGRDLLILLAGNKSIASAFAVCFLERLRGCAIVLASRL